MFQMRATELPLFLGQLRVASRSKPARTNGDPTVNGWNVWPIFSATFVPGDRVYGGLKHTWRGDATPIEMLSCASPKGDWLHVEYWKLQDEEILVKMYTDWN